MLPTTAPSATSADPVAELLRAQLQACAQGDVASFEALYERVVPRVHGLALRVLGDPHQSEEVTQEVFLQLWSTAARYDPDRGSALAWIMTLTHRRAVDRVRTSESGRRRDADHVGDLTRGEATAHDTTVEAAHAAIEAERVRVALQALTPLQRQAIELAYFDGCTHSEVSQVLQIPLGTAKARIRDGLRRLRTLLTVAVAESA